jgi:hypothetical protein
LWPTKEKKVQIGLIDSSMEFRSEISHLSAPGSRLREVRKESQISFGLVLIIVVSGSVRRSDSYQIGKKKNCREDCAWLGDQFGLFFLELAICFCNKHDCGRCGQLTMVWWWR